jgi:hypothetical protein
LIDLAAALGIALSLLSAPWQLEHDRESNAAFDGRTFRFTLGPGVPRAQFAALVAPIEGGLASYSRVTFTASADRPMRVNVDLRPAGGNNPPRWRRSVYLDSAARTVTVRFDDMNPVPRHVTGAAPLATIDALMFTVDTNNTRPATSGAITFSSIELER